MRPEGRSCHPALLAALSGLIACTPSILAGTIMLEELPPAVPVSTQLDATSPARGATQARGRTCAVLPAFLPVALEAAGAHPDASGASKGQLLTAEAPSKRWRLRLDYFQGTDNGLAGILGGDINDISQNGFAVSLGYVLVEEAWGLPLDLIVQGSVMWHDEKNWQDDFLQYTASLKAEWTSFPWNEHLRTRFGFASGWSYASKIPYAEVNNRDSLSSRHFLHYLEPSLSLNCADLFRLVQLDHLFGGFDGSALDHAWLVGSVYHRSGAWGAYGEDDNGDDIDGASNFLAIGIEAEF